MIQVFDAKRKRIAVIKDLDDLQTVKTLSSGDKQISFQYPKTGVHIDALRAENYIRTRTDEYVLKEINTGDTMNEYVATLNIEELEATEYLYGFASETQTARDCLTFAFEGSGWKVGVCEITKRRTIDIEEATNAWKILQEVLDTYRCECEIDSINKIVNLYERIGHDRGAYFIEGLNLRKLAVKSDTYDFYTRIYPVGKDGITPEIILGVPYIDNHQYTDKVIARYWKDERYTITANLIEDAREKLAEASKPYTAYTADVVDLAKQSPDYDILEYDIGDTVTLTSKTEKVKEKQRIVKMTTYEKHPEKNTCELSSIKKTFAQMQEDTEEKLMSDVVNVAESRTKKVLQNGYWTSEQVQAAITSSSDEIKTTVQAVRAESRDAAMQAGDDAKDYAMQLNNATMERLTNEYTTQMQQLQNSFNFSISSVEERVTSQGDEFQTFREENETYFHMSQEGLEIGKKKDGGVLPFSTMLSDMRLEFRQQGKAVAYIQYDKLHILNVEAVRRWSVGAAEDGGFFDFISTQYGMGVKWREAQQEDAAQLEAVAVIDMDVLPQPYKQIVDDAGGVFEVVKV